MNTRSTAMSVSFCARREPHVVERARADTSRAPSSGSRAGSGTLRVDRQRVLRARAPGHDRRDVGGVERRPRGRIAASASVGSADHAATRLLECRALRRIGPALHDRRRSFRRARPCRMRAPASIDMLHSVSRPSIDSARIAEPAYSMAWPVAPSAPMLRDDGEHDVLGGDAGAELAVDGDAHALRLASARASASSAHARLRRRRCRRRRRRARHASRCGCRRRRSAGRAA